MRYALILLATLVGLMTVVGLNAVAQAADEPKVGDVTGPMTISPGALICDTVEEVHTFIDMLAPGEPLFFPEGCGRLSRPAPVLIEFVGFYESDGETFEVSAFLFLPPYGGLGRQFSYRKRVGEELGQAI